MIFANIVSLIILVIGYSLPYLGIPLGSFDVVFYSALPFGVGAFIDFAKISKPRLPFNIVVVLAHLAVALISLLPIRRKERIHSLNILMLNMRN